MIALLFQQFRQNYPAGHLTTELLMLHDGLYIVRATVAERETPIVTAMAVSQDLDQAEQRAQAKALALLGFNQSPTATASTTAAIADLPPLPTQALPSAQDPSAPAALAPQSAAETPPPPVDASRPVDSTIEASAAVERETPAAPALDIPVLDIKDADAAPDVERPIDLDLPDLDAPEEVGRPIHDIPEIPTAEPFTPDLTAFDSTSTDLSDVIAQTDVEMRRLGWTSQQGREHLETTYGKRSRQQLTDEELLEFLLYLESQSMPVG